METRMRALVVHKDDPIPLYYQLAERIREEITAGVLKPGDQLPSAREISDEAGISRMTVRQAIEYLVRQGLLVVRHGAGTFVAAPKLTFRAVNVLGFTQTMIEQGGRPSSTVLQQELTDPSPDVAESLALAPDRHVVKIARLRRSQAVPVVLETVHLPADLCPGLETEDLGEQSLYALLEERYGLRPRWSRQRLEATVANAFEADLFEVPIGTPMLRVSGVTFGPRDRAIETFHAVFRGDRFLFEIESHGPDHRDASEGAPQSMIPMLVESGT
jgi:GntR family transcriptional regulator